MSSSIYIKIYDEISRRTELNPDKITKILEYVSGRKVGSYISVDKLSEDYNITDNDITDIMIVLYKHSIVKKVFKIYCPSCGHISRKMYDNFSEIEEVEYCDECDEAIFESGNYFKYLIVYFKVVSNDIGN